MFFLPFSSVPSAIIRESRRLAAPSKDCLAAVLFEEEEECRFLSFFSAFVVLSSSSLKGSRLSRSRSMKTFRRRWLGTEAEAVSE